MSLFGIAAATRASPAIGMLALVTAIALASVSGFFVIVGMTAIFAPAVVPIMVMVGVLEAAKLVTCAALARYAVTAAAPLTGLVLALMTLTAIGSYSWRPHCLCRQNLPIELKALSGPLTC